MKKIFVLLLTLFLVCSLGVTAFAYDEEIDDSVERLIVGEGLLTSSEEKKISQKLDEIKDKHGMDVFIIVFDRWQDAYGDPLPPIEEFAELALDGLRNGDDAGVLLMLCLETRDWYLQYTDTDDRLPDAETMSEYFLEDFGENDFYQGFINFAEGVDKELSFPLVRNIIIAVAVGLIVGFLVVNSMKSKLKTVQFAKNAHSYVREGSFALDKSRDLYLYSTITRVAKPKNNSSGRSGGGSGRSGGGKF